MQITLAADHLYREPEIAGVNEQTCAACYTCLRACAYHAIERADVRTGRGVFIKHTARVNPGLCMGCGTCVSVCPSKSIELQGFTEQSNVQVVEEMVRMISVMRAYESNQKSIQMQDETVSRLISDVGKPSA